jgi:hypothetical protein
MRDRRSREWLLFSEALLSSARRSSVCLQASSWSPLFSVQRWACRYPTACALWRELRNAPLRTLSLHETGMAYSGLDFQSVAGAYPLGTNECVATLRAYKI